MARSYRFARSPKWVLGHVLALVAAVTMGFLGHWQLDVSDAKGFSLQNFGYALQWWAFACFALIMWGKVLHDVAAPSAEQHAETAPEPEPPVAYRRYVPPSRPTVPADDDELAAYNAYLSGLAKKDER